MDTSITPDGVLDFWFGPPPRASREAWFRKDPVFDAEIRERFGEAVTAALAGDFSDWSATPAGALACVILLDQFPRNVHRNAILGRASTAEEIAFLSEPGSSF
jgi:uncharacterized protein (DUF924 family)